MITDNCKSKIVNRKSKIPLNYLTVEKLTKSFGEKLLFEDITFGIEKGQKTALIAKNGAGNHPC